MIAGLLLTLVGSDATVASPTIADCREGGEDPSS